MAFLRYVRDGRTWRKVSTDEAHSLLSEQRPELLFQSTRRDVLLHGVPVTQVAAHYRPRDRLAQLLATGGQDPLERKLVRVVELLGAGRGDAEWLGVTGSLLVGAQRAGSDIDLVVYDHRAFQQLRQRVGEMTGEGGLQPLDDAMWRETYRRRGCSLTFEQFVWHERRKCNKCQWAGTKVDISWVGPEPAWATRRGKKIARREIAARVIDDQDAFAYPARYVIDHAEIVEIVSYNPTYTGQAQRGESIAAAGWVEQLEDGQLRLLIGTSRESPGEFLRVQNAPTGKTI
jgi:predicted nucleotidyltransferase